MLKTLAFISTFLMIGLVSAGPELINGRPVGALFRGVGMFNGSCTMTKVGPKQFITAAHCVRGNERSMSLNFKDYRGTVAVHSVHVHPSWVLDCGSKRCDGTEVGSPEMTPGRSDVALINVKKTTPAIPIIPIRFEALVSGTEIAMVGGGCTRNIKPGGAGNMRYALSSTLPYSALIHEHSLYRDIAEISGQSNWVTPGYGVGAQNASLCPGDSGGPLLTKNANQAWEICGIAADYTFAGPYQDGAVTVTNLHTRLDDESYNNVGGWIRSVWVD